MGRYHTILLWCAQRGIQWYGGTIPPLDGDIYILSVVWWYQASILQVKAWPMLALHSEILTFGTPRYIRDAKHSKQRYCAYGNDAS